MTITNTKTSEKYTAISGQTAYKYGFKIFHKDHLKVKVLSYELEAGYDASIIAVNNVGEKEGTVIIKEPVAGSTIIIYRETDIIQENDYVENTPFKVESHEEALDYNIAILQEINEKVMKSSSTGIQGSKGDDGAPGVSPYDDTSVYIKDSVCSFDGNLYISIIDDSHIGVTPLDDTSWKRINDNLPDDDSVETKHIKEKAITLSKMADGTPYHMLSYNSLQRPIFSPYLIDIRQKWHSLIMTSPANLDNERELGSTYTNETEQILVVIVSEGTGGNTLVFGSDAKCTLPIETSCTAAGGVWDTDKCTFAATTCTDAGGTWDDDKCIFTKIECEAVGGIWINAIENVSFGKNNVRTFIVMPGESYKAAGSTDGSWVELKIPKQTEEGTQ